MLADPRSEALSTRFAAQWLRLQDIDKVHPDALQFPNFRQQLADDMRRETELFFDSIVRENKSVLELFSADYTFVNEPLAKHYGIPGVRGPDFRRVTYPDDRRRGLLGQASVLMLTSQANRTSPVLRGKWVMEVLLGSPPPPPPPNVPDLEKTEGAKDGRLLTTRERMEQHRANPQCQSCHQYMDPIGLALDNFDVMGQWRTRENGVAGRYAREALRRHAGVEPLRARDGADETPDAAHSDVHAKPARLRARPACRVLRRAYDSDDRVRCGSRRQSCPRLHHRRHQE